MDFETLVLGCVYVQVFPNSWNRWKIGIFEEPRLHFQIFPNSLKSLKIEIFVPLTLYFAKWGGLSFSMTCSVREEEPIYDLCWSVYHIKIINRLQINVFISTEDGIAKKLLLFKTFCYLQSIDYQFMIKFSRKNVR